MKVKPKAGEHSTVVGGSNAKLRRLCTASRVEEKEAPNRGNKWADIGTTCHHMVETAIRRNWNRDELAADYLHTDYWQEGMSGPVTVTPELIDRKCLPALEFFDKIVPETASYHLEHRVSYPVQTPGSALAKAGMPHIPGAFGTGDVLYSDGDGLVGGIDWKFGDRVLISAAGNDQARFYLAGAIATGMLPLVREYQFSIFQPAQGMPPEKWASTATYELDDLLTFAHDLAEAISAPPRYNPGDHCEYCRGKLTCKAFLEHNLAGTRTDVSALTSVQLAEMMALVPTVKRWCQDVEAAVRDNLKRGVTVPGYDLDMVIGNRSWRDLTAAEAALARLGLPIDTRAPRTIVTAPEALRLLRDALVPEAEIERFERDHIRRPVGGEKLVAMQGVKSKPRKKALGEALKTKMLAGSTQKLLTKP
jgi:hypothetical protein